MSRPHLRKLTFAEIRHRGIPAYGPMWICSDGANEGLGFTPARAYAGWKKWDDYYTAMLAPGDDNILRSNPKWPGA